MNGMFSLTARSFRFISCSLLASLLFAGTASAAGRCDEPVSGSLGRFCKADTDKSETLSRSEFLAGFPDMTDQAFLALDSDGNGAIDVDEWNKHMSSHGANRAPMGMPKSNLLISPPKP